MSRLIVCQGKKAVSPYFMETISKNIYTIEELCFYFWTYAHLLDESALDGKLAFWIRTELEMEELGGQMEQIIKNNEGIEELATVVLNSISYLSEQEFSQYIQNLKKMKELTPFERRKRKADDLVRNKKYYKALQEYRVLLKEPEAESEEVASGIYHNMGVVYCRMFFFKQGSECFLKAFLAVPNKESMRQYKMAVRLCEEEIEEDELVKEFPSSQSMDVQIYQDIQTVTEQSSCKSKEIEELSQLKNEGKIAEFYKKLEEILQNWRSECREYMNIR